MFRCSSICVILTSMYGGAGKRTCRCFERASSMADHKALWLSLAPLSEAFAHLMHQRFVSSGGCFRGITGRNQETGYVCLTAIRFLGCFYGRPCPYLCNERLLGRTQQIIRLSHGSCVSGSEQLHTYSASDAVRLPLRPCMSEGEVSYVAAVMLGNSSNSLAE